jgi:hypothetical protein
MCGGAFADATLSNLDSPHRNPGSFWVTFKSCTELAKLSQAQLQSLGVLPSVLPVSEDTLLKLATAMAAQVGGTVESWTYLANGSTFSIKGASDNAIANILAKDPRLKSIDANIMQGPAEIRPSDGHH